MRFIVFPIALALFGCATIPVTPPEVTRLQAFADSIESGWRIRVGWANRGYLASMVVAVETAWQRDIWVRDEVIGTPCAELVVAGLFARRDSHIPMTFGQRHVDKEAVKLLARRGWSSDQLRIAQASCPDNLPDLEARPLRAVEP